MTIHKINQYKPIEKNENPNKKAFSQGAFVCLRIKKRHGKIIKGIIKKLKGSLELVHYDSDKSYYGRKWSQEIIWKNLCDGGIFISDDIEDNTAFMEFVSLHNLQFSVLEFEQKYVGVIKKLA